jgi:hypothetical protein
MNQSERAALLDAQSVYDYRSEPAMSSDIAERIDAIDAAEEFLAKARAELCNFDPHLLHIDMLIARAADCLLADDGSDE